MLFVHVLRNALLPVVTLAGFEVVFLMSGQIIVETIFNLPGIGKLFVQAVASRTTRCCKRLSCSSPWWCCWRT